MRSNTMVILLASALLMGCASRDSILVDMKTWQGLRGTNSLTFAEVVELAESPKAAHTRFVLKFDDKTTEVDAAEFLKVSGVLIMANPFAAIVELDRNFLLRRADHKAIAKACLDMITMPKYKPLAEGHVDGDDPRLPPDIRAMKSSYLYVGTNDVLIVHRGGFVGIGYIFVPRANDPTLYDLSFCDEDARGHDILVYSIRKE